MEFTLFSDSAGVSAYWIDAGVILIGDVNATANNCMILAEMKGCQVSKWFMETEVLEFQEFSQSRVRLLVEVKYTMIVF